MSGARLESRSDREKGENAPVEWVRWVGDLDFFDWVLEGGIKLWDRLTQFIIESS